MVYLKFSRVRIIKLKLCNGKSSCSDCAWCTYYVLHVCALLSSPCRRYKEAHQTSTFCFLLGDNFKTKTFLQEAQCSLNMMTCAVKTAGQRNKPSLWLSSFTATPVAAFEIHRNSLKQSEPRGPTALRNDAQAAKVVHTQNKPTAHRKEEPFEQHPDIQPLLQWMVYGQPLQMLVGECRGRHPWRRRMVTFT